jgi:hypothetical protein
MQFERHFSLDEARALLPELRRIFRDAHARYARLQKAEQHLARLLQQTGGDLGGPAVTGPLLDLQQLDNQLQRIHALGIQIKDFHRGLVDFPHIRDGREVFLCWELAEEDIGFWHPLDTGYSGRQRL